MLRELCAIETWLVRVQWESMSLSETSHSCDSLEENMIVLGLCHENLYEAE